MNYNETDFREFVQEVLNNEHVISLESGQTIVSNSKTISFDLFDKKNGFYVEIKQNYSSINRSSYIKNINNLAQSAFSLTERNHYNIILAVDTEITKNDRLYFEKELKSNSKISYFIYDIDDLVIFAKKYKIPYSKFLNKENYTNLEFQLHDNKISEKSIDSKTKELFFNSFQKFNGSFWWLNASEEITNASKFEIGHVFNYSIYSNNNRLRTNFKKINIGDISISYQKDKHIVDGIYQVVSSSSEEYITFKLIDKLPLKLSWQELTEIEGFENSSVGRARTQGSAYELSFKLFIEILIKAEVNISSFIENINSVGNGFIHGGSDFTPPIPPNDENNNDNNHEDDSSSIFNLNDQTKFRHDVAVEVDELGRQSVAKEFVSLIENDIFSSTNDNSFIVHLQGEWGAGKSSFLNFIKSELKSNQLDKPWVVIEYNAWQNQHIEPPWWTLLNQIYRQAKNQVSSWRQRRILCLKENLRRIKWYNNWKNFIAIIITITFIIILLFNFQTIKNVFVSKTQNSDLVFISELIVGFGSALGVIHAFSKLLSGSILIRSSEDAEGFIKKSQDPMSTIKQHYQSLIDNIKLKKTNVAIFIDDIDRCNDEYVVNLLEGIQTLFKERKVLYIIAGDRKWLSKCFQNIYNNFDVASNRADNIGELFLQKTFQLSIRIPSISSDYREKYWHNIIGLENHSSKKTSFEELNQAQKDEIKEKISEAGDNISNPQFMAELELNYDLTGNTVNNLIIKKVNEKQKEFEHTLKDYHTILDINPRSILRLSNNYNIARAILISERKNYNPDKLVRWILIEELYPFVSDKLNEFDEINEVIIDFNETVKVKTEQMRFKQLIEGSVIVNGGNLTMEDIKNLKGI